MFFFNTPKFWYKPSTFVTRLLNWGLVWFYKQIKSEYYAFEPMMETIAIGGVTLGGAGKTPVAKYIYSSLKARGKIPAICLRGYGRKSFDAIVVDQHNHKFQDVGDEALLLSKYATVIVSADRKKAHDIAISLGVDTLILDDGFEQRDIRPTKKVLVIDGFQGIGNGLLFPLGPLRNSLQDSVKKSDYVIMINEDKHCLERFIPDCIHAYTISDLSEIPRDIIAFSGLGMNEKFFNSLRAYSNLVKTFEFPDHYPYTESDIEKMLKYEKQLVTTEKDYQRIPDKFKGNVKYIPIDLRCEHEWL